jgi:hypothetical protein
MVSPRFVMGLGSVICAMISRCSRQSQEKDLGRIGGEWAWVNRFLLHACTGMGGVRTLSLTPLLSRPGYGANYGSGYGANFGMASVAPGARPAPLASQPSSAARGSNLPTAHLGC